VSEHAGRAGDERYESSRCKAAIIAAFVEYDEKRMGIAQLLAALATARDDLSEAAFEGSDDHPIPVWPLEPLL
jgi:hypothetical protein